MKHFASRAILALSITLVGAAQVLADPISISNVTGGWQNANPGAAITNQGGQGVDSVNWGTPVTGDLVSGYDFDPVDGTINPTLGVAFALGLFTHRNQPIFGTPITSIEYAFAFDTNGLPPALSDVFNFAHDETPNSGNVGDCVYPSTAVCADAVTVSSVNLNSLITVGSDVYFFNLLGFSTNGGVTISSQFISQEGGNNSATLYGIVTSERVGVPDGGITMLMLGVSLAGIATLRNRFRI